MKNKVLKVKLREEGIKAKRVRQQGFIPAILYGEKIKNLNLMVNDLDFKHLVQKGIRETSLVDLQGEEKGFKGRTVLLKEIQTDPVSDFPIHLDFVEVDLAKKISVEVRLEFIGEAMGVKEGGVLQPLLRELKVRCLPTNIPEKIQVDVSSLKIGDAIHLDSLSLPDLEPEYDTNVTIVTVAAPTKEEKVAAPVAEGVPVEGEEAAPVEGQAVPEGEKKATPTEKAGEKPKVGERPKAGEKPGKEEKPKEKK